MRRVNEADNGSEVSQSGVVGLVQHIWWDMLNQYFDRIFLGSGYLHPLSVTESSISI
jgi:hypothetical protein